MTIEGRNTMGIQSKNKENPDGARLYVGNKAIESGLFR